MKPSEIEKLADLAKLQISTETIEEVTTRITNVLALVDQLKLANTDGVEPMAHPLDAKQILRPDEVTEPNRREEFQKIAPAIEDGLYLVPKVIE